MNNRVDAIARSVDPVTLEVVRNKLEGIAGEVEGYHQQMSKVFAFRFRLFVCVAARGLPAAAGFGARATRCCSSSARGWLSSKGV